jgi:hypothetical protein
MNLLKYLLMSSFGGITINIGLCDSKTKVLVNTEYMIEHTITGQSIKI